jgi:two-component system CheB/CheR fusion protein
MTARELEVQDRQGRWYSLRIRPYKNVDNRIDGAVLTLMDIGAVKRYQEQVERSRQHLLATLDLMAQPIIVVDDEQVVRAATQSFYETFSLHSADVVGRPLFDIAKKRWSAPALRSLVKQLRESDAASSTEIDHDLTGDGIARRYRISGLQLPIENSRWTVLAVQDVSHGDGAT